MKYIAHRVNTIEQLMQVPTHYGVELDLRDCGERLILAHDPFVEGEDFENYLRRYRHGTMILNIKSERIEHRVLGLLRKYKIADYFFLDSSFPMIYHLSSLGEKNIALRFSEFEGMDTVRAMAGKVRWLWVDCFTKAPISRDIYDEAKSFGMNLCFVSPELQGRDADIEAYAQIFRDEGIVFDAICTKDYNVERWEGVSALCLK